MTITILPFLVCVIGLVIYVLTDKAKIVEIGKTMFWTGLLVVLYMASHGQHPF